MKSVIDGFETLTRQQVFDMVVTHLLTQGRKSTNGSEAQEGGTCLYRGSEGTKCAAGIFLTDEFAYTHEFRGWNSLVKQKQVPSVNSNLIQSLQRVHDQTPVFKWELQLKAIGTANNLSFNPPK